MKQKDQITPMGEGETAGARSWFRRGAKLASYGLTEAANYCFQVGYHLIAPKEPVSKFAEDWFFKGIEELTQGSTVLAEDSFDKMTLHIQNASHR